MLTIAAACWLCRQPLYFRHHGICCFCQRRLPPPPSCCPRCGLPSGDAELPCGRCIRRPPPWHALIFVSDYRPPFSALLQRFKFQGKTELARALARQILLRWLSCRRQRRLSAAALAKPDWLFTVPLHRGRR